MTEILSPGVFIEERASDLQTIQAVSTSNAAFVGFTPQGPSDLATLCTSYADAVRKFGGLTRKSTLGYMLAAFFQNGGSRAFVVRVSPDDGVVATAKIRSLTTDQQIETGATGTAAFTKTAGASVLKDNGGVTPLVPSTINFRWRAAGPTVAAQLTRVRAGTTSLTTTSGVAVYEGRLDPKATRLISGPTVNGGVYYRSVADGGVAVEVTHVNAGASQALAVSVSGNRVTVTLATDGSAVVTSTATQVAAAVTASLTASALLTATATGNGSGLVNAAEVLPLSGLPALTENNMDALVPGSLVLTWQSNGTPATLTFAGLTTSPTQTATNGAGSTATLDLQTGRFSLVLAAAELPVSGDTGVAITAAYTPAATTSVLTDDGAGVFAAGSLLTVPGAIGYADGSYSFTTKAPTSAIRAIGSGGNGTVTITVDAPGALGNEYTVTIVLPGGTAALSARLVGTAITVNLAVTTGVPTVGANTATLIAAAITALPGVTAAASGTGADEITAAAAAVAFAGGVTDTRPHNLARVLATYQIQAWSAAAVSKGLWGNNLRLQISGDPLYYTTATAAFTRFRLNVLLKDDTTGAYATVEDGDELVFDDPEADQYWADVVNELSDYYTVALPGGDEAPGQLQGIARRFVVAAGDETSGGQVLTFTLPNGPIAGRSVTIAYTDVDGVARTITDNGFGVLSGSVDPAYAAVVSSLGPNRINATSGAVNVKTLLGIRRGTLVTVTYASSPAETTHTEDFGVVAAGGTAGTDGTFDATNYGRNQISEPTALGPAYRGLYALSRVDEIMQVVVPDFAGDVTVSADIIDYAEARASQNASGGDRFAILTVPLGSSAQEAADWVQNQLNRPSKYAAVYWPWIRLRDPLANNRLTSIAPLGHIAGVYARTDATRNVGKAPAGTVDGQLAFITELELRTTQGERDYVYPRNINPLREDAQVGRCVWGARTIAALSSWRQVNAVRLFMFVEKSVYNATHWIVFENNGPGLWARIKLQLEGFLSGLFVDGYFAGATRAEAYAIVVDSTNNPQAVIDAGQVVVDVSIAPNKPAEFVRFRFQQRSLAA